ncbi:hypothetical protein OHA21_43060 [Actinoplanes sp. NBC_00393]|uniref:HAAS signaling domain-containing protein n=1 Tax=Actinoplanes sp. NBC_00393 TaxID=2975953 RepID=UPI002E2104C0
MNLTAQDEIASYVEQVRLALAHLPATTREELLEDLPEHLAEVLAEGGGSLVDRLGTPQAYAAELSASAGIAGSGKAPRPPAGAARLAELRGRLGEATRRADVRVGPLLGYAKASDFLVLLRPAWWVLRGYLVAMALAYMFYNAGAPLGLLPRIEDNELLGLLLLIGTVLGSIWLGRRGPLVKPVQRFLLGAGTVLLLLFAVVGLFEADEQARRSGYIETTTYVSDYNGVDDVFVFDSQGKLVQGAQLYDQNGQPIKIGGDAFCLDDEGNEIESRRLGYPRCPEQAPFLMAVPEESVAPTPSAAAPSPSASAAPSSSSTK